MKISRGQIIAIALGLFLIIVLMNGCSSYNSMSEKDEKVTRQWKQVENVYQRRMDLIPNIVAVVKKNAEFEKTTLEALVSARSKATQITVSPENLDAESMKKYQAAQGELSQALGRFLSITENYPQLQTNTAFQNLVAEIEGSENRIAFERKTFNETVEDYNKKIRKFPSNMWAGIFGFEKRDYFEMKQGADVAPDVDALFDK